MLDNNDAVESNDDNEKEESDITKDTPIDQSSDKNTVVTDIKSVHNLDHLKLLVDIKMNLIVEIGKTEMSIDKILHLGLGSIVELDKSIGDKVDVFINGKLIAKAELVSIDDNFGIRITEIIEIQERLKLYNT